MTNEQINIAIAKACGWDSDDIARGYTLCQFTEDAPDYCNDLNAMHEAEKVFTYEEAQQFEGELCYICGSENLHKEYPLPFEFSVAHATAQQRAEAFLKTIGKWEGGTK
jgi:hypothetical protein